jgi:tetratricopeptide (TPR) repeat protein
MAHSILSASWRGSMVGFDNIDDFAQFTKGRVLITLLDLELETISEHLDAAQEMIDSFLENKDGFIQSEIEKYKKEEEENPSYGDDNNEEWANFVFNRKYHKLYPQIVLGGFILTIYSVIERYLIDICEILRLSITVSPKGCENFSRGIYRARKLLKEVGNYEINPDHWKELIHISRLRNQLIHNGYKYTLQDMEEIDPESVEAKMSFEYAAINNDMLCYLEEKAITNDFGEIIPHYNYIDDLKTFARKIILQICVDTNIYYPGIS